MTDQTLKDINRAFKALEERNELLDKIKADIAEEICLTNNPYTKETKYTIEHSRLLEILDKYKMESEE